VTLVRQAARTRAALAGVIALASATTGCSKGFGSSFEGEVTLTTTRPNVPPMTTVIKAKGDRIRFDVALADGKTSSAIFLPDQNKLLTLVDERKTAVETDLGSPFAPDPNTDSRKSTVVKAGESLTVAGIGCEYYVIKDGSGARTEACVAPGLPFLDLEALRRGQASSQWSRDMRAKRTFPLRRVDFDAKGKEVIRTEVTQVRKEKLDDAVFQVPADYKVVPRT
jgi:hypothetical protein